MTRLVCVALIALVASSIAIAQQPKQKARAAPEEVGVREVLRRGDMVEHVTGDMEDVSPGDRLIGQIAATPAVDNDKWHISVVWRRDCAPCKALAELWKTDRTLRAWAVPGSPHDSWSHFGSYNYDDPLEGWRWKRCPQNPSGIEIKAFPTIVVQPPRNGRYGPPATTVFQYVWEGDPQAFDRQLRAALRRYADTLLRAGKIQASADDEPPKTSGSWNRLSGRPDPPEAPENSPSGAYQSLDSDPSASDLIGQQQVPPLNLPANPLDEPSDDRRQPAAARGLVGSLFGRTIVIVEDPDAVSDPQLKRAIDARVAELQPANGPKYHVRKMDVARAASLGVTPDEAPTVLLVEGAAGRANVRSKLLARVEDVEHERGSLFGVYFLLSWLFGGGSALLYTLAKAIEVAMILGVVMMVVIVVGGVVLFVRSRQPARVDPDELAKAVAAAMRAAKDSEAAAAKV